MTSIFAYPLSNAWVIVGDRLETDIPNTIRQRDGFEVSPIQMSKKLEIQANWVIGFAGISSQIERIKPIILSNLDITQRFNYIMDELDALYSNKDEIECFCILLNIEDLHCYKIDFSNTSSRNLEDYRIASIEQGFIGSGANACRGNCLLSQLNGLQTVELNDNNNQIIHTAVNTLNNISIIDFQFTGNPYVYGCDVIICQNNSARHFEIIPNGFKYREGTQEWEFMERM